MKDRHLALNQTQRVRLEAALQELQSVAPAAAVTVADTIPVNQEDNILKYRASISLSLSVSFFPFLSIREQPMGGCSWRRGHGTSDQDGEVVATLCGVVERVNKLVYVRTLRARYARGSALQWRTYSSATVEEFGPGFLSIGQIH
jgi:hypothetical protein